MIAEAIDAVVGWVSPKEKLKRIQYRNAANVMRSAGGIQAGKQSRTYDTWTPANRSADSWILDHGKMTRARARDLYTNNAYARGGINAFVRNVVGRGIRPQSRTDDEQFNAAAEDLFNRHIPFFDVTGRMDFFEMQRAVLLEALVAGDALQHFVDVTDDPIRPIPLGLESIDIDRLADDQYAYRRVQSNLPDGHQIRLGIEYDGLGRDVRYWIYKTHPEDINTFNSTPVPIQAEEMLHLFMQERFGQTRGISKLASVVWWLKNLDKYVEAEVVARNVAACFGIAIKTFDGGSGEGLGSRITGDDTSDSSGNSFEFLEPGMINRLMPGEDITSINPNRQSAEGDIFIKSMLRSAGVGMGIGYSRITKDFSQTTFSSARAEELEDRKEFRIWQDWLINHYCRPIWKKLVIAGVEKGIEGFPTAEEFIVNPEFYLKHEWLAPGWEWVNPKDESQADQIALQEDITTLEEIWLRQGKDPREQWNRLKRDLENRLEIAQMKAQISQIENPQPQGAASGQEGQNAGA